MAKLFTCIVFYNDNANKQISKFRNVNKAGIDRLKKWSLLNNVARFNVYEKETKFFVEQIKISND
jgi:hypothetical protein